MRAIQRRRLIWTVIRTVAVTCAVLTLHWAGALDRFEKNLYNLRAGRCQHFTPPPTKQLVHFDVDEDALSQIGRWPWGRDVISDILEEIRLAGPKVLAMDVLFSEEERKAFDAKGQTVDRDAILAATLRKFDRVLLPASFTFDVRPPFDATEQKLLNLLIANPEATEAQAVGQLQAAGLRSATLAGEVAAKFNTIREQAIHGRIEHELDVAPGDSARVKKRVLPHIDPRFFTPLEHVFDQQYTRAVTERAMMRFTFPIPANLPPVLRASDAIIPIPLLSSAARFSAFVDYLPDEIDGTVRAVPMVAEYRGRLLPQMSLAIVCALLDVDPKDLRLSARSITIPRHGGPDIVIPVGSRDTSRYGPVGMLVQLPVFGKRDIWTTMYDFPRYQNPVQHVSAYDAWQICQTTQRINNNNRVRTVDPPLAAARTLGSSVPADDVLHELDGPAKHELVEHVIAELKEATSSPDLPPEIKGPMVKERQPIISELNAYLQLNAPLEKQRDQLRAAFREKLHGKAVIFGGTGTGNMDVVATALHHTCPGVVVHGILVNGILTGRMFRVAPDWLSYIIIATLGLLTGLFAVTLRPWLAFAAAIVLTAGYLLVNGFLLYDYFQIMVTTAGPVLVTGSVWSGLTLTNFINEMAERGRITKRFSNYVDPSLVSFVIEHPEISRFDGEAREMTMCFTDLAGFTTMVEKIGQRAVPLLREYMNYMIPTIREHGGYVSRLMGDGIYFFFNAPRPDADHALHAVGSLLKMYKLLDKMNQTLPARNYETLNMRGGCCTGKVVVGDAGSTEFTDYTAVGDSVNTAARLESANKFFGTRILCNARSIELVKEHFLVRPIANVRVMGKTKGIHVFEPLALKEEATPEQVKLAELSTRLVHTFQTGDYPACLAAADLLDQTYGEGKFTKLYCKLAKKYLEGATPEPEGEVILDEK
jgi:class 3 adenylate cyclase